MEFTYSPGEVMRSRRKAGYSISIMASRSCCQGPSYTGFQTPRTKLTQMLLICTPAAFEWLVQESVEHLLARGIKLWTSESGGGSRIRKDRIGTRSFRRIGGLALRSKPGLAAR